MASTGLAITGLGVVSAAGVGREAFYRALASGYSGIAPDENEEGVAFCARIGDFGARQAIDPRSLRRMARLSQLALVAAKEALADARLDCPPERVGIVLGTGLGTVRETIEFMQGYITHGPDAASPLLFPSSVMNAAAGQMAIELGLRGLNTTINHRELSPFGALLLAADQLLLGRADAILVGGMDELCRPALHGWRRLGRLSPTGIRPYARDRDGSVPGEGAAVIVLEREEDARRRGVHRRGRLAGQGAAGDDRPRMGWGMVWEGAARSMREAMACAGIEPEQIDYVAGGGSGLALDELEVRAVDAALGVTRPIGSILGQTGEFLASGALRWAAALFALEKQCLPGTVGAGEVDQEWPPIDLVRSPRPASVEAVLIPLLAKGGADAAVVFTRGDA